MTQRERIEDLAARYDRKYGFPKGFLSAIIQIESNYDPKAFRKESGGRYSMGLMQVLRGGAIDEYEKVYGSKPDSWYYDIENNIKVGAWYLGEKIPRLLKHFDQVNTIKNVVWAYNAGIGNLIKGVFPDITKLYVKKLQRHGIDISIQSGGAGGKVAAFRALNNRYIDFQIEEAQAKIRFLE